MRRIQMLVIALLVIPVAISTPMAAQDAEISYDEEWSELERGIESYTQIRDRELMAIERLKEIAATLQDAADDPNLPVQELRRLDALMGEAWDEAYGLSKKTSESRSRLYARMDTLAQLVREMDVQGPSTGTRRSSPAGRWRFEASPVDVTGVLNLELSGHEVTGEISSSNGTRSLVRGTVFDGHFKLQRLGPALEILGGIIGDLDPETGELSGTWSSRDLGSGLPSQGEWRAWPVNDREDGQGRKGPQS